MKTLNWTTFQHMVMIEALTFIHKCIYERVPDTIMELLSFNNHRDQINRAIRRPTIKDGIDSNKAKQSLIFHSIF